MSVSERTRKRHALLVSTQHRLKISAIDKNLVTEVTKEYDSRDWEVVDDVVICTKESSILNDTVGPSMFAPSATIACMYARSKFVSNAATARAMNLQPTVRKSFRQKLPQEDRQAAFVYQHIEDILVKQERVFLQSLCTDKTDNKQVQKHSTSKTVSLFIYSWFVC